MHTNLTRTSASLLIGLGMLAGTTLNVFAQTSGLTNGTVTEGAAVTMQYLITIPGEPHTAYRDVAQFVQGEHQILPAFERQVAGMQQGEEKQFQLSADEGFGPYEEGKRHTIQKSALPPSVKEGDIVGDQQGRPATVVQMNAESAVLDFNHPLAGKPIAVTLKILKVEGRPSPAM